MKIEIDVSSWSEEEFSKYVSDRLMERVEKRVREAIDAAIDSHVMKAAKAHVDAVVEARITPIIDAIIADGWETTDNYGTRTGTVTLASLVRNAATAPRSDGSYSKKPSLLHEISTSMINELIAKELRPAAEEWRKAMRAQLDASLTEAVAKAMRQAMGIS